uniref:Peptidase S1 domain-containing protein n=1 Tax=Trichuris muris TaxID=70415 RepID=A0A5S6QWF7_TRIMR
MTDCTTLQSTAAECGYAHYGNIFYRPAYSNIENRIVGGIVAPPNAFPWQALIQRTFPSLVTCGGSLIQLDKSRNDSDLVLTAAHCLYDKDRNVWIDSTNITVILGAYNRLNPYEHTRQVFPVQDYLAHSYHPHATENDIAVLKLQSTARHAAVINPICVPQRKDFLPLGTTCLTSGWGIANTMDSFGALRMTYLSVALREICGDTPLRHPYEICTRNFGLRGICHGDSGSPLMCLHEGRYFIFGIATWVTQCGDVSAFTDVSYYSDWIRRVARWLDQ